MPGLYETSNCLKDVDRKILTEFKKRYGEHPYGVFANFDRHTNLQKEELYKNVRHAFILGWLGKEQQPDTVSNGNEDD